MDLNNLNKKIQEPKVSRLLPNVCDFQKENHTLGYGFKTLLKIYIVAYGFLFFVISISVLIGHIATFKNHQKNPLKTLENIPQAFVTNIKRKIRHRKTCATFMTHSKNC